MCKKKKIYSCPRFPVSITSTPFLSGSSTIGMSHKRKKHLLTLIFLAEPGKSGGSNSNKEREKARYSQRKEGHHGDHHHQWAMGKGTDTHNSLLSVDVALLQASAEPFILDNEYKKTVISFFCK